MEPETAPDLHGPADGPGPPLGLGVSYTATKLVSWSSIWMQNCHWALAFPSPQPNSDQEQRSIVSDDCKYPQQMELETENGLPGMANGHITTIGPQHVQGLLRTWIRSKDHWCQMTLSIDAEMKQKHHLAYVGQRMNKELPLGIGV
ncbi:hypothetical protein NN561_019311 [Cricetulus griseus]